MNEVRIVYKRQGVTPLQLIREFRKENPKYEDEKIGFAGRLDPLAHGVMLLTVGEANKQSLPAEAGKDRAYYLGLNKTYRFSVLVGVETDTYDYLGILKSLQILELPSGYKEQILQFIKNHHGKYIQPYPPFSSKTINGIPLFKLAKRGRIKNHESRIMNQNWPEKEVEIFKFKLVDDKLVNSSDIRNIILSNLKKIRGYFRQNRIIRQWEEFFKLNSNRNFRLLSFEIDCSSGTYVRSLAHKLGQALGCGAIAFEILRTKVGTFELPKSLRLKI